MIHIPILLSYKFTIFPIISWNLAFPNPHPHLFVHFQINSFIALVSCVQDQELILNRHEEFWWKSLHATTMDQLPGSMGTSASLALRLGQTIFSTASLLFMCLDVEFYSYTSFWYLRLLSPTLYWFYLVLQCPCLCFFLFLFFWNLMAVMENYPANWFWFVVSDFRFYWSLVKNLEIV